MYILQEDGAELEGFRGALALPESGARPLVVAADSDEAERMLRDTRAFLKDLEDRKWPLPITWAAGERSQAYVLCKLSMELPHVVIVGREVELIGSRHAVTSAWERLEQNKQLDEPCEELLLAPTAALAQVLIRNKDLDRLPLKSDVEYNFRPNSSWPATAVVSVRGIKRTVLGCLSELRAEVDKAVSGYGERVVEEDKEGEIDLTIAKEVDSKLRPYRSSLWVTDHSEEVGVSLTLVDERTDGVARCQVQLQVDDSVEATTAMLALAQCHLMGRDMGVIPCPTSVVRTMRSLDGCTFQWVWFAHLEDGMKEYDPPISALITTTLAPDTTRVSLGMLPNGQTYELDVASGLQTNVRTGVSRKIHAFPSPGEPDEVGPRFCVLVDREARPHRCVLAGPTGQLDDAYKFVKEHVERLVAEQAKLGGISVPDHWSDKLTEEATAEEIRQVQSLFPGVRLIKVLRIQNPKLWKRYVTMRDHIQNEQKMSTAEVESLMLHGSRDTDPERIYGAEGTGFDFRHAREGYYGRGAYFTKSHNYAHNYGHPIESGRRRAVFVAQVAVGKTDLRRHQDQSIVKPNPGFDSVTGPVTPERTMATIIYDVSQAYPKFLVTY